MENSDRGLVVHGLVVRGSWLLMEFLSTKFSRCIIGLMIGWILISTAYLCMMTRKDLGIVEIYDSCEERVTLHRGEKVLYCYRIPSLAPSDGYVSIEWSQSKEALILYRYAIVPTSFDRKMKKHPSSLSDSSWSISYTASRELFIHPMPYYKKEFVYYESKDVTIYIQAEMPFYAIENASTVSEDNNEQVTVATVPMVIGRNRDIIPQFTDTGLYGYPTIVLGSKRIRSRTVKPYGLGSILHYNLIVTKPSLVLFDIFLSSKEGICSAYLWIGKGENDEMTDIVARVKAAHGGIEFRNDGKAVYGECTQSDDIPSMSSIKKISEGTWDVILYLEIYRGDVPNAMRFEVAPANLTMLS